MSPRKLRKIELFDRIQPGRFGCNSVTTTTHPALLNDVILLQIFGLLDLNQLKKCRLVCCKWNEVGNANFKKLVRIHFDCICFSDVSLQGNVRPEDLNTFFKKAQEKFPFTAITFGGQLPWTTTTLSRFFASEGRFITDLILADVLLISRRKFQANCDLRGIINGIENLKRLRIVNDNISSNKTTVFELSLEELKNLQYIGLEKCTLELTKHTKIVPEVLHLRRVTFTRKNVSPNEVMINDFVDFSEMKAVSIIGMFDSVTRLSKIKLDLQGKVNLNYLSLERVEVLNFESSSWNTKSLKISMVTIPIKYSLKFTEFSVKFAKLSLKNLPKTVTKLIVDMRTKFIDESPFDTSIPNIIFLELHSEEAIQEILPHLSTSFNHMKKLKLQSFNSCRIDVNMIPKSIEVLILHSENFEFVGDGILTLDTLIVEKILSLEYILKITKHLAPRNLNVCRNYCGVNAKSEMVHLNTLSNTMIPNVMLGHFFGELLQYFKNYPTCKIVDNFNGQIINDKGSTIHFSFNDETGTLLSIRQTKINTWYL